MEIAGSLFLEFLGALIEGLAHLGWYGIVWVVNIVRAHCRDRRVRPGLP